MQKSLKIIMPFIIILFSLVINCSASDIVQINNIIENSIELDNTEVTVQGEVIGEVLKRGEYAWVNINDGTNAIGIWIKESDVEHIQFYGDYKNKGDIITVTGIFYNACSEHGGDPDIHCVNLKIEKTGYAVKQEVSYIKILITAILIAVTILILITYYRLIRKK